MVDAFGANRINVKPPERGIFPLDHDSECKSFMKVTLLHLRLVVNLEYFLIPTVCCRCIWSVCPRQVMIPFPVDITRRSI